jgi:hypothetical protein
VSRSPLESYLRDHHAGSVVALELLDHWRDEEGPLDVAPVIATLREDIAADQQMLRTVIDQLGASEGPLRHVGAWFSEKVAQLKLRLDDPGQKGLRHLEILESLCLGIHGKLCLWNALETVRDEIPALANIDFAGLKARARDQHDRVEAQRILAARLALSPAPPEAGPSARSPQEG